MDIKIIEKELLSHKNEDKIKVYKRFFKTEKGQYGYGDKFLGLTTPILNSVVNKYWNDITLDEIEKFLHSQFHEFRMFGLSCLKRKFLKLKNEDLKNEIYNLYLKNTKYINNWDLVDVTAPKIVGEYLKDKDRSVLYDLVESENLWEQRIAIMSTFAFIYINDFEDTLKLSKILLNHKHDLIHKAVGWMLREVGNRNLDVEEKFLKKYYKDMPRTMLRYAIEKFEESKRSKYLKGLI